MTARPSPFLAALRLSRTQLGFLAVIFIGTTFIFSFSDRRITFILWEHRPAIGILLVAIGAVLALGWVVGRGTNSTSRSKIETETGTDRRHKSIRETDRLESKESSQALITAVQQFMANDEFRDDATVVCIRTLSPNA